ncbi:MAG: TonB-dependent receptor [bacterium]
MECNQLRLAKVLVGSFWLFGLGLLGFWEPAPAAGAQTVASEASIVAPGEGEEPGEAAVGGLSAELDSMEAQAEEATKDGGRISGVSANVTRRIEEIVVSARKREESLEETPVSVTALGASALVEHGVTRLDDIQEMVPNLTFQRNPEGQDAMVRIRGIGTPRASIQFDPGVGIYVDGVFLSRSAGGLIDVLDVQQIEVLRGPQGTLFGKNTVGGALNISAVRPHENVEASVLVRAGNFASINARAMLNLPIVEDRLLSRFAVSTDRSEGYVFNESRGEYLSGRDNLNFVGSLRYLPLDELTIDLTGSWSRSRSPGRGGKCIYIQPTGLQGLVPDWPEECRRSRPYRIEANKQLVDNETYGMWGTALWDVGSVGPLDDLSLKSITSWREQRSRFSSDADGTASRLIELAQTGNGPLGGFPGSARQISQEIQVNGQALDDRLVFVGGYFYFTETADSGQAQVINLGSFNRYTRNLLETNNWNWAFYGQGTFEATDWLSLTGGIRYSEEKKGLSANNRPIDPETGEFLPPAALPLTDRDSDAIFSAWTPTATVALQLPEAVLGNSAVGHLMGYCTYARGFKGGGFNALGQNASADLEPFSPEFLDSFEVGAKTIALDQRLTVNVSFFFGKYDDIQVTSIRDVGTVEAPEILQLTINAAKATTRGLELELYAIPFEGFEITGSVGVIDARYDNYMGINDLNNEDINRAGETFNNTPQLQTFLALQYSFPIDLRKNRSMSGWLTPRLEWGYQNEVH